MPQQFDDPSGWHRSPLERVSARDWKIHRVKGTKKESWIIASSDVIGRLVHYDGYRTQPHDLENCQLCKLGFTPRDKGYILGVQVGSNLRHLLELVPRVFDGLRNHFDAHRTLRGVELSMWRSGKANNSPVAYSIKEATPFTVKIGLGPDVIPILMNMWARSDQSPAVRKLLIARAEEEERIETRNEDDRRNEAAG